MILGNGPNADPTPRALRWTHAVSLHSADGARNLPAGAVTFLVADIAGAAALRREAPQEMRLVTSRVAALVDRAVHRHHGIRPDGYDDPGIVAAFSRASDALDAAVDAQRDLEVERWTTPFPIRVRMAVHTGDTGFAGGPDAASAIAVRAAELRALASGSQVLVSSASRDVSLERLSPGVALRDLGEHRLKDLAPTERVFQLTHPDLKSDFAALRTLDATPNNLPVRLSTFIGRRRELAALDDLLASQRLVTVTGAGGAGKTRLALQGAANVADKFPDGIWWIELAPVSDSTAVALTVADVVEIRLNETQDYARTVAGRLGDDRALLVLDNCEHLVDACAELIEAILQRCPNVTVMATSRRPLDIPGEVTWRVPPLALPEPGVDLPIEQLGRFDSVQLFTDRARDVRPTFVFAESNAAAIAGICQRLDGIPLAIELAAARAKTMLPSRILEGLSDALRLLTGGSRRVLPRQQTLDASVAWSCQLLDEAERVLLFRLSVFSGSFDLRSAEAVCSGDGIDVMGVLDALEQLVDSSLVMAVAGDESRFAVLETVRQYAAREILASGDGARLAERHADHFERLVHDVAPACETDRQFPSIAAIVDDYDNIRASLGWLVDQGHGDRLAAMVLSLGSFWDVSGKRVDAAVWCRRALEAISEEPSSTRARLYALSAESRMQIGEFSGGYRDSTTALEMGTALGDAWAAGRGSATLTTVMGTVDFDAWRHRWSETERLHREANDVYSLTRLLTWRGVQFVRRGMTREGIAALADAVPQIRATAHPGLTASQQMWEAYAALHVGDLARAEDLSRTAVQTRALCSASRMAIAESATAISRAYRFLERPGAAFHLDRASRATRENDPLTADLYLYGALMELLHEDPSACVRTVDAWHEAHPRRTPLSRAVEAIAGAYAAYALGHLDDAAVRGGRRTRGGQPPVTVCWIRRVRRCCWVPSPLPATTPSWPSRMRAKQSRCSRCTGTSSASATRWSSSRRSPSNARDRVEAATVLGACSTQRAVMGTPRGFFIDLAPAARDRTVLAMGSEAFERAFAAGAALSLDGVLAYVERTRGTRGRPSLGWNSLSPTERQVAELVRAGLTNREIAQRLIMGTETVKTHVSHIFAKLGIGKRSQLATLATEQAHQERHPPSGPPPGAPSFPQPGQRIPRSDRAR